jgi:hypothetical protein
VDGHSRPDYPGIYMLSGPGAMELVDSTIMHACTVSVVYTIIILYHYITFLYIMGALVVIFVIELFD